MLDEFGKTWLQMEYFHDELGSWRHDASFRFSYLGVFLFRKLRHDASFWLSYLGVFYSENKFAYFCFFRAITRETSIAENLLKRSRINFFPSKMCFTAVFFMRTFFLICVGTWEKDVAFLFRKCLLDGNTRHLKFFLQMFLCVQIWSDFIAAKPMDMCRGPQWGRR